MDSGAFEQNGFSVDLINACRNSCEASHNTSIEVNNQFHLSDGIWLPLLLSFHCTVARERQKALLGLAQCSRSIAVRRCRSTGFVTKSAAPNGIAMPRSLRTVTMITGMSRSSTPALSSLSAL